MAQNTRLLFGHHHRDTDLRDLKLFSADVEPCLGILRERVVNVSVRMFCSWPFELGRCSLSYPEVLTHLPG